MFVGVSLTNKSSLKEGLNTSVIPCRMYSSILSSRTVLLAACFLYNFHDFQEHDTNPFHHEMIPHHCCYFGWNNYHTFHCHYTIIIFSIPIFLSVSAFVLSVLSLTLVNNSSSFECNSHWSSSWWLSIAALLKAMSCGTSGTLALQEIATHSDLCRCNTSSKKFTTDWTFAWWLVCSFLPLTLLLYLWLKQDGNMAWTTLCALERRCNGIACGSDVAVLTTVCDSHCYSCAV